MKIFENNKLSATAIMIWLVGVLFFKFIFFDIIWALDTSFRGFQFIIGYSNKLLLCCLLALPMVIIRRKWYAFTISFVVDAWLISNLLYFRTYFTIIPASSYLLIGNLADFQASVWESLRLSDAVFPLSTIAMIAAWWHTDVHKVLKGAVRKITLWLCAGIILPALLLAGYVAYFGGYKQAFDSIIFHDLRIGATVFTIPGELLYEPLCSATEYTPEIEEEVGKWLARKAEPDNIPYSITPRQNCIIILVESFESWLIGTKVNGQELTPCINRLVAEDSVFYGPNMQTQVKGSHSMDAQLMIHTGLLPINYGSFSFRFPHHTYFTLDKAFKENRGADAVTASFTTDRSSVWNAAVVAQDFGYDFLKDKRAWVQNQKIGPRKRLGDESFLRQSYQMLKSDKIWKDGQPALVQIVTYTSHSPFIIPDNFKHLKFSDNIPERLRDYMHAVNFTDRAIGMFVDSIRSNPKFDNTMIVITGDHEGLGTERASYMKNNEVAKWLSPDKFTPFIVLNSPMKMRYDGVLGQVDMYPTLLDLLGLGSYPWHGLGRSLLDPGKQPFAIATDMAVVCKKDIPETEIDHARKAYAISDLIICSDYFHNSPNFAK